MNIEEKRAIMLEVYGPRGIVVQQWLGPTRCIVKAKTPRSQFDFDDEVEAANREIRRRFGLEES